MAPPPAPTTTIRSPTAASSARREPSRPSSPPPDYPSFILARVNPHPILARELDAQGIPYTIVVLPQAGVTIITPARTVDPATVIDGLAQDYGANQ